MRKEQLQRYIQYFYRYIRFATGRKIINLLKNEFLFATNNYSIGGIYPHFLVVDISNTCPLECPLCQTGLRKTIKRENKITHETFTEIISPLKNNLFQIFLYNWSEPFLNRDIYSIISTIKKSYIACTVSSNLNVPINAEKLVESKLDHLIVSADGISNDIYTLYRRGGDINKVIENIKAIVAEKKKQHSKYPYIEWQCLVHKFNENHLSQIKKKALELGANTVRFSNLNFFSVDNDSSIQAYWLPNNPKFRKLAMASTVSSPDCKKKTRKQCFWLWRSATIMCDGSVLPCCLYDMNGWGNVFNDSLINIWNNTTFTAARLRSQNRAEVNCTHLICDSCTAPFIYKEKV